MTDNNTQLQGMQGEEKEDLISVMEIATLFIKHWKWIVLGLLVALAAAFVYLRYTTPVYKVASSVVLKEEGRSGPSAMPGTLEEIAMMSSVSNVENELYILKSRSMIRSVINRLDLHTSYIVEGRIKSVDLYTQSPVIVDMAQSDLDRLRETIHFEMQMESEERVHIRGTVAGNALDTIFTQLPAVILTDVGAISFTRRHEIKPDNRLLYISIQHPDAVIGTYRGNLEVTQASRQATVINLALNTPYREKGRDFINTLIEVYNNEAIEDKNQEARNTQLFIEERIAIIDNELSTAEQNVEEYKREEGLTDLQTDLQRDMQMGSQYEQRLVEVETQLNVVSSLNSYLDNPANSNKTIPSNIGVQDPTLSATTSEYNRLLLERERLSQSMTDDNPAMKRLNEQISGLRESIGASINSVQQGLQIQRREARNQANLFGGRVSAVPTQEREFMELSREQQIKASLFLMLLQKREENALALAAYANKAKVLDEAASEGMVAPRRMIILLAALMLGLLIPMGIIYLMDMLQYRIRTRGDVDRVTKVPILSEVPKHEEQENIAVMENETRPIDEAFRMLRTNLLLTLGAENKVVTFTSTVSGEGKSFVALNTAISLSLLNKRVLLVGLDLRIPRLREYMNLETRDGITGYLSGFEKDLDSLIVPSGITENLFALPSGAIPPNPAELLSRPSLDAAFAKLREEFDYIIIDSAPVSQVTDTLILNRVSDATVYVCRANYSSKGNLRFANDMMAQNRLKNMVLVVNDVDEFHHAYGYGYGRGYGYGYGKQKKKKK
ncbi:polysaccharide biosynthesis tyrosine autokinase [Dysgonomonadaceae bacterium zrk40]|nr:polysaccharide biosynthesis tyrosine autokinase [Dysgonomonadaceae bacterium zrk40]